MTSTCGYSPRGGGSLKWVLIVLTSLASLAIFRAAGTEKEEAPCRPIRDYGPDLLGPGKSLLRYPATPTPAHVSREASGAFAHDSLSVAVGTPGTPFGDPPSVSVLDRSDGRRRLRIDPTDHPISGCPCVAFSPDGGTLAVALDTEVTLYDAGSGQERARFPAPRTEISALAYSPDGLRLAIAVEDQVVVYDSWTGREVTRIEPATRRVFALAFSPDGRTIATATMGPVLCYPVGFLGTGGVSCRADGGRASLWDAATGRVVREFRHREFAYAVAFSPDGGTLASAGGDGVRLWDVVEGRGRRIVSDPVFCLAYSPDGGTLAMGGGDPGGDPGDGEVYLWDTGSARVRAVLRGDIGRIRGLAYAPDGRSLMGCGGRGASLWDPVAAGGGAEGIGR